MPAQCDSNCMPAGIAFQIAVLLGSRHVDLAYNNKRNQLHDAAVTPFSNHSPDTLILMPAVASLNAVIAGEVLCTVSYAALST